MLDYKIEHWNPWTTKSDQTPFNSSIDSVGDGEQKLGKELVEVLEVEFLSLPMEG